MGLGRDDAAARAQYTRARGRAAGDDGQRGGGNVYAPLVHHVGACSLQYWGLIRRFLDGRTHYVGQDEIGCSGWKRRDHLRACDRRPKRVIQTNSGGHVP